MSDNNDPIDIFKGAAEAASKITIKEKAILTIKENNEKLSEDIVEEAIAIVDKGWNKLMNRMITDNADRFSKIMDESSDREFTRLYLKLLEYARPKKIREQPKQIEDNNILQIVITRQEDLSEKIIDIT